MSEKPPVSTAVALRALVRGRVQGVGFRDWVRRRARELGLNGSARNFPDGTTVEVIAEGARPALDALAAALKLGPPGAYVTAVDTTWTDATAAYDGFTIA
ncbi:MAG TPA: acylphosphatase [Dehalococcoidia bacterium]|nr:acylphosphatase [Dehalococcoidia bacterium]